MIWRDRIYSPLVTLWVFLGQVLSADSCCRAAVARLLAHRLSQGQSPCSAETGGYCQARSRLPEALLRRFVLVQPGVEHTFANRTAEPVRVLNIHAPAGFDRRLMGD